MSIVEELRDEAAAAEAAAKATVVDTATAVPPTDETGEAVSTDSSSQQATDTAGSDDAVANDNSADGLMAATKDERRKRQKAEEDLQKIMQENAVLRGQMEVIRQPQQPKSDTEPEFDAAKLDADFLTSPAETSKMLAEQQLLRAEQSRWRRRLNYDLEDLKEEGVNVEEVESVFLGIAKEDQRIAERFRHSDNPGRYASSVVKKHQEKLASQSGSTEKLTRLEAENKKLQEQLKALSKQQGLAAEITESNAGAKSTGTAPSSRTTGLDEYEQAQLKWRKPR